MPDNETKPPELAVLDPHHVRNLWAKAHPPCPMDYAKIGRIRREIAEGTYLTPEKEAVAVERLIDAADKGDFTAAVATGMADADVADAMLPGLTLPAAGVGTDEANDETPVREWDGGE